MPAKQFTWIGSVHDGFSFFGIRIGGDIGTTHAQEIIDYLEEDEKNKAHIVLSSNGGQAYIATRMVDMLSGYRERITMEINGLSASAGSLLAFAIPNELYVRDASQVMIHGPSSFTEGTLQQHRNAVQRLEKLTDILRDIYKDNAELSDAQIQDALDNELWLTPKEMVKYKVATKILKPNKRVKAIIDKADEESNGDKSSLLLNFPMKEVAAALQGVTLDSSLSNTSTESLLPEQVDETATDVLDENQETTPDNSNDNSSGENNSIPGLPSNTEGEAALSQENAQLRILVESQREEIIELRKRINNQGKTNQEVRNKESIEEAVRTGRIMPSEKKKWEDRLDKGGELLRKSLMERPPSDYFIENGVAFDDTSIEAVPANIRNDLEKQGYSAEEIIAVYNQEKASGRIK